ncbi:MAG: hypothetical protein QGH99_02570 [Pseudomonadales bacterium]|jgi:hypothetical protein|nr:hypothetical protein [Pseudomonadales bacterium]MDP6316148.1 hypothetical protein [Pseudomonadales bacterium]MDP7315618.1 hypothetical protein [Pseudomonadales bacterium]MDP7575822.1 hypothetical protein [Pseudomonadales bacterium]HJP52860.1 hypothetical protein [Pseudomonadales bacterium]|tara:strand:- start:774 stop:1268 length:495 start_codon:yes stop_codon:yes gene_type:complete
MSDYVRYIDKTREYYLSQGYDKPYKWAHFEDIPFTELTKPLDQCRATIVSTSSITYRQEEASDAPHATLTDSVYSIDTDVPKDRLFTDIGHFDSHETTLEDVDSFYPVTHLRNLVAEGRLDSLATRCHGVLTSYSQRRTLEVDAPEVLRRCREDQVDVAFMVPV